jgi:hypothetical protein
MTTEELVAPLPDLVVRTEQPPPIPVPGPVRDARLADEFPLGDQLLVEQPLALGMDALNLLSRSDAGGQAPQAGRRMLYFR